MLELGSTKLFDLYSVRMTARLFYNQDCPLDDLKGKTIVFLGYRNQGRAQALNMVGTHPIVSMHITVRVTLPSLQIYRVFTDQQLSETHSRMKN